jgi:hypothetical protein
MIRRSSACGHTFNHGYLYSPKCSLTRTSGALVKVEFFSAGFVTPRTLTLSISTPSGGHVPCLSSRLQPLHVLSKHKRPPPTTRLFMPLGVGPISSVSKKFAMSAVRYIRGLGITAAKRSQFGSGVLQIACRVKTWASSSRESILSVTDDCVELCVSAKAKDGEANKAVVELVAHISHSSFISITPDPCIY